MVVNFVLNAIVKFMPAAFANSAPVFANHVLKGKFGTPVDFGFSLRNHRILGDGKTWRGLFAGIFTGYLVGLFFGNGGLGLLLGAGAMFGDLVGSFIKRRLGFKRGDYAGFLDQVDFVGGAILFTISLWSFPEIVMLFLIFPPIHRISNWTAHRWSMKAVPW